MNIIDLLLAFGLLTAILYGLYSALLRWLRTPLSGTSEAGHVNNRPRNHRAPRAVARRQNADIHAFQSLRK